MENLEDEVERLRHLVNHYKAGLLLIYENAPPSKIWLIADRTLHGKFNEEIDMAEGGRIKIDVIERMESAIKQRTCLWESDIKLAIDEIIELRKQVQELKDNAHLKKLNKIKEVE